MCENMRISRKPINRTSVCTGFPQDDYASENKHTQSSLTSATGMQLMHGIKMPCGGERERGAEI